MLHRSFADLKAPRAGPNGCVMPALPPSSSIFALRRCIRLWLGVCLLFTSGAALPLSAQEARWKELNAQVVQFYKQGKFAEAIPPAQASLRVAEATFGAEHPNVATSLNNLCQLYVVQGRFAEAEPLSKRALTIQEKVLGPEHPDVAISLVNLAELYLAQGRYAEAEPLQKRALAIFEKALGPEHPNVAVSLNDLALLYRNQGRYAEAEPLYKRALAIREKALGPDHSDVADSLNNLGALYESQGRYAEAEPLEKRALAISEKAFGPEHPNVASSLSNLAALYLAQGRYAEAEPLYKRALAIREKAFGPEHPLVASSLNDVAELYRKQGRYAEAEPLYKRALAIREKALGPEHPLVAVSLNDLALQYEEQGRYAEAEPLQKRALAIDEKAFGPEHPNVASSLSNLAALYWAQGRYAEAEPLYKRALAIQEKALGPDHPDVATSLNNLAELYSQQGHYADSETLLKWALTILEKALGPDDPNVASSLNNLAGLYHDQGRYADAEPLNKRALAIREKALGPEHPDVATSLNNLAELYRAQGRYAEAEPLYKRALAINEKALGPDHPYVATSSDNLALLFYARAQPAQAGPFFDRTLETLGKQFEYYFTYMSEKERLAFLATVEIRFPMYFSFCFTYREQVPGLAGKMYDTVLWEKGFIAQSAAALRAKIQAGGDPEALRLLDQLAEKKSELAKLVSAPPSTDALQQAEWRKQVAELEQEANDLEKELVQRSGTLAEEKRLAHVTWQQVRDALKKDEAAVEIVSFPFYDGKKWTGQTYYVALIVTPESQQPHFVVLGEPKDSANPPLEDYRRFVSAVQERAPAIGTKFYESFWQPLESALGTARRVYVSTDGALNQVSLGVVPRDDGKLLIDVYDLRIVSSTKDLLRSPHPPANDSAVLVGDPRFLLSSEQQRTAVARLRSQPGQQEAVLTSFEPDLSASLRSSTLAERGACNPPPQGGVLCPLPGTAVEVQSIASLLRAKNWQVSIYQQENALEEAVKAAQHPRVLHLSTHGFFLSDQQVNRTGAVGAEPVSQAPPVYPTVAKAAHISGTVILHAIIGKDGSVEQLEYVSGPPLLMKSALDAVRQWRYKPTLSNGQPVEADTTISVTYSLGKSIDVSTKENTSARSDATDDPMLRSGLFFAGADRVLAGEPPLADADNGVLTAYEATTLNLQGTELVVLSACETGLGQTQAGEGVFGLRRALQEAGADSVLMSMWSVPDKETQELMSLFYEKWLGGTDKHEALRAAQQEMRERVRVRYKQDLPFYWGAFVLVGR